MDERLQKLQLAVSSAALGQIALLNALVAWQNANALPEDLRAAVLAGNRRAGRLAEQVSDAIADAVPEWQRDPDDDE